MDGVCIGHLAKVQIMTECSVRLPAGVLEVAEELRYRIPDDLSVVSYDDIPHLYLGFSSQPWLTRP